MGNASGRRQRQKVKDGLANARRMETKEEEKKAQKQ